MSEDGIRAKIHPSLRDSFIPLPSDPAQLTKEHVDAIFPPENQRRFILMLRRLQEGKAQGGQTLVVGEE